MRDPDPQLEDLFRSAPGPGDDEAFVTRTMSRVRSAQARASALRLALRVLGLAALVVLSPWLIEASTRASLWLEWALTSPMAWWASPLAAATAALIALLVVRGWQRLR